MARLPAVGSDDNTWGTILNDFLLQAHASGGSLKSGVVTDDTIAASAGIAQTKIANLTSDLGGKLSASSNLNDVSSKSSARTNLAVPEASGFTKITVGTTAPTSPAVGDVWIDTN